MKKIIVGLLVAALIVVSLPMYALAETVGTKDDNPIESISISDVTVYENIGGWYCEEWDSENQQIVEYYYYTYSPSFEVILKDGRVFNSYGSWINIDNVDYWLYCVNDSQSYQNPWVSGGSYTVTWALHSNASGQILAFDTFSVTVEENPVESIEIEDITVIEGTNGNFWIDYDEYGNEHKYYHYSYDSPQAVITLKNGQIIESDDSWVCLDGKYYYIDFTENQYQTYDNPWTAGNSYEVAASFMGVSDTFTVTIAESPIKSIKIDDITVDSFDGYYATYWDEYNERRFYFEYTYEPHFNITLNDGRVIESKGFEILIDGVYYPLYVTDTQDLNPWIPGNSYKAEGSLMGVSDTFTVMVENSVAFVEIEDITVYKDIDGYWDYDGFFYYCIEPSFKITMKDGKTYQSECGVISIDNNENYGYIFSPTYQSSENQFETGKTYEMTGYIFGVSDTFSVTVEENPIKKIAVKKYPKTEYLEGECFDLYGAQLRISYVDGTYEDVDITAHSDPINGTHQFFVKKFGRWFGFSEEIDNNESAAVINLLGKTISIDIFISENLTELITLRENEYKQPVITVYNSDGTTYDITVKSLQACSRYIEDNCIYSEGGLLYSDKGNFDYIYEEDNFGNCRFGLRKNGTGSYIYTNRIPKLKWTQIAKNIISDTGLAYCFFENREYFNGIITKDNIDGIIAVSLCHSNRDYSVINGETVKKAVYDVFGIDVDLSLTDKYDSQTDIYTFAYGYGGVFPANYEIKYADNRWSATASYRAESANQYKTVNFEYDDDLKIKSFSIGEKQNSLIGDADDDGNINAKDLVILTKALLTETEYSKAFDANGDGVFDIQDLVRMKKYLADNTVPLG